jgi:carbonic anhydrase
VVALAIVFLTGRPGAPAEPSVETSHEDKPSAGTPHGHKTASISGPEALQRLRDGNRRFVADELEHPHESRDWRAAIETGQHPFAVILGCADSRVPPELVFDQGFGDLFVVRVAGNIVDVDVTASVEYAVDHLDTRLVVVMGHTQCGAVKAALDHLTDSMAEPDEVVSLLYRIEPALKDLPRELDPQHKADLAVKHNVELAVQRLSQVPDLMKSLKSGKLTIVGGVYDMHSGKVEFLESDAKTIPAPK